MPEPKNIRIMGVILSVIISYYVIYELFLRGKWSK